MTAVLLSIHVLAAIVLIGPVTAAASLFPRYARQALDELPEHGGADGVVRALHRISSGYAVLAVAVPVFGIGTAARLHVLGQAWLIVAMVLTAAAGLLLAVAIVPGQRRVLAVLDATDTAPAAPGLRLPGAALLARTVARLSMLTGVFALTWAVVVVLMIVRPGSTTGV